MENYVMTLKVTSLIDVQVSAKSLDDACNILADKIENDKIDILSDGEVSDWELHAIDSCLV